MAQQDKDDRSLEMQTGKDPQTPIRLVNTNKTSCYTNASVECQLQSDKDTHVGAQKIAFASDGRRVGITCKSLRFDSFPPRSSTDFLSVWVVWDCTGSDDTLRVWDIKPQSSESARLAHNSSILGMCWMEYDTGILTLCSDGSVNAWTPKVCFLRLSFTLLILFNCDRPGQKMAP